MILEIKDLNFSYFPISKSSIDTFAIRNINLKIETPKIIGILGPNGSGKSTLIRTILGFNNPFSGEILINNEDIKKITRKKLATHTAFVPQEHNINFSITVLDIVLTGRYPYQNRFSFESEEDIEIANQVLKELNIDKYAAYPFIALSQGEKERVLIARALAQMTKLLILDEPTAFLDVASQINLCNLLKQLKDEKGITTLMVTHNLYLAKDYCDEILILKNGNLVEFGHPTKVLKNETIEKVFEVKVGAII